MGEFGSKGEWSIRESLEKKGRVLAFLAAFLGVPEQKVSASFEKFEANHSIPTVDDETVDDFLAENMDELVEESGLEDETVQPETAPGDEEAPEPIEEVGEPFVITLSASPSELSNETDETGVSVEDHVDRVQAAIERVLGEEIPRVKNAAEGQEQGGRFYILSNPNEEGYIGRMDIQNGEQNFGSVYIGKDGTYAFWPQVGNNIQRISVENEDDLEKLIQEYQDYQDILVGAKQGDPEMKETLEETIHFKNFADQEES